VSQAAPASRHTTKAFFMMIIVFHFWMRKSEGREERVLENPRRPGGLPH
jgi:hypothetical protein